MLGNMEPKVQHKSNWLLYYCALKAKLPFCFTKYDTMKICGSGDTAPRILDFGTRRWNGQLHSWDALRQGKVPQVPTG
jgi:hypothetical protein